MGQKGFLFDQQFCIGCQACVASCNVRHGLEAGVFPRQATSNQHKISGPHLAYSCNHCDEPACAAVCPTGALSKRDDGIVVHDVDVCIGCYSCVSACPYGAPQKNERDGKMVKCDMCAARLDKNESAACVLTCPMKVISIGDIEEFEKEGAVKEGVDFTVEPTGPNIRFIPIKTF